MKEKECGLTFNQFARILCGFRLVPARKAGSVKKTRVLRKHFSKNCALPDEESNTSRPLNRGDIADLFLLRTMSRII